MFILMVPTLTKHRIVGYLPVGGTEDGLLFTGNSPDFKKKMLVDTCFQSSFRLIKQ